MGTYVVVRISQQYGYVNALAKVIDSNVRAESKTAAIKKVKKEHPRLDPGYYVAVEKVTVNGYKTN